jgi:hypothetical protein
MDCPGLFVRSFCSTPPTSAGANETMEAALDPSQLQDFVEESAPALTKMLVGAALEFLVKIRLKGKRPANLGAVNDVLKKIKPAWTFGG